MSRASEDHACFYGCLTCLERKTAPKPVLAYTIPYSTYRLLMCLRCAKTYPEGPGKQPVTDPSELDWAGCCDRCHCNIPREPTA